MHIRYQVFGIGYLILASGFPPQCGGFGVSRQKTLGHTTDLS